MTDEPRSSGDERILTPRLELVPVTPDDADEMAEVFADECMYEFLGGGPPALEEWRAILARVASARDAEEGSMTQQRNWTVRRRTDGTAGGMLQATFADAGQTAEVAWAVGVPWQGQRFASEAARAMVTWLANRGVRTITCHIHPDHRASAAVAASAGLQPSGDYRDQEQLWRWRA
jgi:RimJ/RimL family protein N-acetyltransferase